MTTIAPGASHDPSARPKSDLTDQLYWLARVDEDIPKAVIVPDRKRTAEGVRYYNDIPFELDAQTVRLLRGLHPAHGVGDLAICAGLVAALMAKMQREDRLVLGARGASMADDAGLLLPLHLACHRAATIRSATDDVARQLQEMAGHSTADVADLAQILGLEPSRHRHPLYDIAVIASAQRPKIDLEAHPVDLAFLFETAEGRIAGRLRYAQDLFDRASVERIAGYLLVAAGALARRPETAFGDLDVMDDAERQRVVVEFNRRRATFPTDRTFHALFEAQALRSPQAVAVVHGERRLDYQELNARANRLAHALLSRGLKKGDFVGILLQRGCDFVVAMLAVFKAGGAYVPLDPSYPRDRVAYMLDDSRCNLLITCRTQASTYGDMFAACTHLRAVLSTDEAIEHAAAAGQPDIRWVSASQYDSESSTNPNLALNGRDRAYMIYTSGSTGRPKGAICRHDGALNHLFGELAGIGIEGAFNFLQTAASSSDISVWQFMAPLLFGGATVVADYEAVVDPALLRGLLQRERIHVAEPVPVVLRWLIDHLSAMAPADRALPDLRCMMCTGEALPAELVDRWLALYPMIPVANTYGPTETSDDVTLNVLRSPIGERFAVTPIGPPLANVHVFLLDRDLRPVPVGVPGEICIAGIAVGEGYWQQPDKTEAAFVACPFTELAPGPMYRTGDLGRWGPDGVIEFLGRVDQQVKVRGFRVEPGEIEQVMIGFPGIQDAAVVAVPDPMGNPRLVGHFVVQPGASVDTAGLRQYLKQRLAEHMVPAVLSPLGALPLTPLGKVDRRSLARAEMPGAAAGEGFVAPRNEVEQQVAQVWADVVGVERVGVHDNFFEIGGDSILTIHAVAALRRRGFELAPRQLFRHPTVAELALALGAGSAEPAAEHVTSVGASAAWDVARWRELMAPLFPDLQDVYPLSATQRGIYFQSLLVPRSTGAYVEQIGFELQGLLDPALLEQAWQHVVQAEDVLRTAVLRRGVQFPLQAVVRSAALTLARLDLRELPAQRRQARLEALLIEDRTRGFDLKHPPLTRVTLVQLASDRWYVLWSYHHLILDGWAEPLILQSVFETYRALALGRSPTPHAPTRYRDFVIWAESHDVAASEGFWRAQLEGFTDPVSIRDLSPGVAPPARDELSHGWADAALPARALDDLKQVGRRSGLTLSTILHAAWALLLARESGADDVLFGSITSGRQGKLAGIEGVRGLVAATLALRVRVPADAVVSSWLRLLQLQLADMREHEQTPLANIQQWSAVPAAKRPLFDSIVVVGNYAGSDLGGCKTDALQPTGVRYVTQPLMAFTLFAMVEPTLSLTLVYDRKRCAPETAHRLTADLAALLAAMAENPEQRIANLLALRVEARAA